MKKKITLDLTDLEIYLAHLEARISALEDTLLLGADRYKSCVLCGGRFQSSHHDAMYCSDACKLRAWRLKKKVGA